MFQIFDLGKIEGINFSEKNLVIRNGDRTIFVDDDACHHVYGSLDETVTKSGKTVRDVLACEPVGEVASIKEFLAHWGVKDRVRANYQLLFQSIRGIGLDTNTFPKWGT